METNRRIFLKKSMAAAGVVSFSGRINETCPEGFFEPLIDPVPYPPDEGSEDENYWWYIKNCYTSSPNIMNLNNGGVCPQPKVVQDAFEKYNCFSNEGLSNYMWQIVGQGRETVRDDLAALADCSEEEVAIVVRGKGYAILRTTGWKD